MNNIKNRKNVLTLLIFLVVCTFYIPLAGSYGLFDPWETHYSEVARTMLQRQDPISTYWQDEGFYSKPVGLFWLQAAGMKAFGLNHTGTDKSDEMAVSSKPEWAVRLPVIILSALAIAFLFNLVMTFAGLKAAFFSSIFLMIMPYYALISRQSITDIPFLALMTMAMVMFIRGFFRDDDESDEIAQIPLGKGRRFSFRVVHAVNLFIIVSVVPQYLLFASSVDASLLIGKKRYEFSGFLVFLPYLLCAADAVVSNIRGKSSAANHFMQAGFVFAGFAILAKGFGAFFIPAGAFFVYIALTGEWDKLHRFDILKGVLLVIAVSFPWHHAMMIRHGGAFFQEYIVHHHFKRAAMGVHGERGTFTYYITQMLFGLVPLLPLIPAAISSAFRRLSSKSPSELDKGDKLLLMTFVWAAVTFLLFSLMLTKFHHYMLPVTVPIAVLCGIYAARSEEKGLGIAFIAGIALAALVLREYFLDSAHFVNLFIYKYERLFPYELNFHYWLGAAGALTIAAYAFTAFVRKPFAWAAYIVAALFFTGYLIYAYIPAVAPHWSQKELHRIYFQCRADSSERFIAWQLNWRGENFYSKNKVLPYMELDSKNFLSYLRRYAVKETTEDPSGRFLLLEIHRLERLRGVMDREFYKKNPHLYKGKDSKELVTIVGPGCKSIPSDSAPHKRMSNFKVLKHPYPHNKFILVKIMI
ncbi:glycosyltransferase family 39 protein [Myxococcota bacterium]|nr:glycosyltransferase family 39 protein [Myxococcota bacterium]MBU1380944.1 glycosyltransferase family 39 protein [Myxococcota bacterium]MBU1495753.1 glycosyltransferase family 39 protein [Myxococcota bacterium]